MTSPVAWATLRSDADVGWAAKGANPEGSCDVGDFAESVIWHNVEGVDESTPSDTMVSLSGWVITSDAAWCIVDVAPTLSIAGGGAWKADDPDVPSCVGVDKAGANIGVTVDFDSSIRVVWWPGN